jgi:hypothetical protein
VLSHVGGNAVHYLPREMLYATRDKLFSAVHSVLYRADKGVVAFLCSSQKGINVKSAPFRMEKNAIWGVLCQQRKVLFMTQGPRIMGQCNK